MTSPRLKDEGITEIDLERARWHVDHGTQQFRKFLCTGAYELVGFARWLKDRNLGTVAAP